jgi:aromatic ring hydroxylase
MRITHCRVCNKELINRRSHIKTCSSTCRGTLWRTTNLLNSIKLVFSPKQFERVKYNAQSADMSLINFIHSRALMGPDQ